MGSLSPEGSESPNILFLSALPTLQRGSHDSLPLNPRMERNGEADRERWNLDIFNRENSS